MSLPVLVRRRATCPARVTPHRFVVDAGLCQCMSSVLELGPEAAVYIECIVFPARYLGGTTNMNVYIKYSIFLRRVLSLNTHPCRIRGNSQ